MIVDTDIIIRFLTGDDATKAGRFNKLLDQEESLTLTDVTFAETYWTLHKFYKFSDPQIIEGLESLLSYECLSANKLVLRKTLEILAKYRVSFIDAYTSSYALLEDTGEVLSYDKGYDKVAGVKRLEP